MIIERLHASTRLWCMQHLSNQTIKIINNETEIPIRHRQNVAMNLPTFNEIYLSWAKDMNLLHSFCKSSYNHHRVRWAKPRGMFVCFFFFFCLAHSTLLPYKSLIIVENFQKIPLDSAEEDATCWRNEQSYQSNLASVKFIQTAKISNIFSLNLFLWASYFKNY